MCVTVDYAYLELRNCFVRVECVKRGVVALNKTMQIMNGTTQCIKDLPPNSSCNVTATDIHVHTINQIYSISAYTILGVAVPNYHTNTTDYHTNTTTG